MQLQDTIFINVAKTPDINVVKLSVKRQKKITKKIAHFINYAKIYQKLGSDPSKTG